MVLFFRIMANRKKRYEQEQLLLEKQQQNRQHLQRHKQQRKVGLRPVLAFFMEARSVKCFDEHEEKVLLLALYRCRRGLDKINKEGFDLLEEVLSYPKPLFNDLNYYLLLARALLNLNKKRALHRWKTPRSKDDRVVFESLFFHFFVQYKIPHCINDLIGRYRDQLTCGPEEQIMYEIVQGKGIHQLSGFGVKLNSKMNFYFNASPAGMSLSSAIWWAKMRSMGLSASVACKLVSNIYVWMENEWFPWLDDLVFFLKRFPGLGKRERQKILDFILCQKNGGREVTIPNYDETVRVAALFPGFSFKGRSVASVFRFIAQWDEYIQLAKEAGVDKIFPISPLQGLRINHADGQIIIRQIKNLRNLVKEGNSMNHCVATYAPQCIGGYSSIWSMRQISASGKLKRLLTIEVQESDKRIQEVRGKSNRVAKKREEVWINTWVAANKEMSYLE